MRAGGSRHVYTYAAAAEWCRQLASALSYLHGANPVVLHRDLKLDNVLLRGASRVCVCGGGRGSARAAYRTCVCLSCMCVCACAQPTDTHAALCHARMTQHKRTSARAHAHVRTQSATGRATSRCV